MPKAYYLLADNDLHPEVDVCEEAYELGALTSFECIDHIYFDDDDHDQPYIAH
tara:strand:+ start:693 stop:851 length:159 start_codon:yes stop_codon:yes gene_type:complete